jgi:hypothetical protein
MRSSSGLFGATVGAFDLCGVYIGDRLGLYRALAESGPASAAELASAAGLHERYVLEWLEQQAACAILDVVDVEDGVQRFVLPPGHAEALLDEESLSYASPFGRLLVACLRPIDALLDAYRNGGGVPYADYGADLREGQAAFTRPLFLRLLLRSGCRPCPRSMRGCRTTRPRVADLACRGRDLEHCDRARVPESAPRRHRPRPGVGRAAPPPSRSERRRG